MIDQPVVITNPIPMKKIIILFISSRIEYHPCEEI